MRISELDSVRGLASLVVLFHHCWQVLLPDQNTFAYGGIDVGSHDLGWAYWLNSSPLRLLFSGHAAVGVFFVLSGFVLTRFLEHSRQDSYANYMTRRLFRIWAPFAIVILIAAILCAKLGNQPIPDHPWINLSWNTPVDLNLITGHLLMVGVPPYDSLDNPMWSLVHELRISLLFPFLLVMTKRFPIAVTLIATLFFMVLSAGHTYNFLFGGIHDAFAAGVVYSAAQTIRYALFFILGILLSINAEAIHTVLLKNQTLKILLVFFAWIALALPYTKGYVDLAYALGAFVLLALCMASELVRQVLRHPALVWLGKISYSLYLVHLVVMLSMIHALVGRLPLVTIVAMAVPCSLIAALITNIWIEQPFNELGKRLAMKLSFS